MMPEMNSDHLPISICIIMLGMIVTMILTGWVRKYLISRAILDIPNERSSHVIPVPRGGGWALLFILCPALLGAAFLIDGTAQHAGLIIALFILAGISGLDDRRQVSASRRLSMHILAACLGSFSFAPTQMLLGGTVPFWLDRTLMILGWAWFINLYNFMDGIDGITGVETISIATGVSLVLGAAGLDLPFVGFLTLILTGVSLGFLVYNWHPARIFLGDVGSVPLGFLTGFALLSLAVEGHLVSALILPLYYLADSGITITKRAWRREKIWQAHREHFYQKAALRTKGHDRVVLLIAVANGGLVVASMVALTHATEGFLAAILIVAVLLGTLHKIASKN